MEKEICPDCGGTIHGPYCKLCEMFGAGEAAAAAQGTEGWPIHSEALKVHTKQIPEATALAKAKGVPVRFDKHGRPVFTSGRQFCEYAKAHGFVHRGY